MHDVRTLNLQKLIKFGVDCLYGLEVMSHHVIQDFSGGHLGFCPIGPNFELAKVSLTVNPHTKFQKYLSIFGCCIVSRNPDRQTDRLTDGTPFYYPSAAPREG
jgi:hypothetical protein